MTQTKQSVFLECFGQIEDPRMDRQKKHNLLDIIATGVCAVIAGADSWVDVADFAKAKEPWLRAFLEDQSRIRTNYAAENMASARAKRIIAAWDDSFLKDVLMGL